MNQFVILRLGAGNLQQGFPAVSAQIGTDTNPHQLQLTASLPSAPELPQLYRNWQFIYKALYDRLGWRLRISFQESEGTVTQVSEVEFRQICQQLKTKLNQWLHSEEFRPIYQRLRTHLAPDRAVQILLETDDIQLRQLPWHLWDFFQDYRQAEMALSTPNRELVSPPQRLSQGNSSRFSQTNASRFSLENALRFSLGDASVFSLGDASGFSYGNASRTQIKILAVLGNSEGIEVIEDRAVLEKLPNAELTCLEEPQPKTIHDRLWRDNWDIFFFAGHSSSQAEGEIGRMEINSSQSLSVGDWQNALRHAIEGGLRLAIFNSCDGLGFVRELEKLNLNIPQIIVMREQVPDRVAQAFLTYFLEAFSRGEDFPIAVREARERLQAIEDEFPCASWLPAICQNPAADLFIWPAAKLPNPTRIAPTHIAQGMVAGILGACLAIVPFNFSPLPEFLNQLGLEAYHKKELAKAERLYQGSIWLNALRQGESYGKVQYNLGLLYEDRDRLDRARQAYIRAIEKGILQAYNNLGRLEIMAGNYERAVQLLLAGLQKVEAEVPPLERDLVQLSLHKNMGWARLEQGRYQEAETHLQEAILLDDSQAAARCLLAQVRESQGQAEAALWEWELCLGYGFSTQSPEEDRWIGIALEKLASKGEKP